MRAFVIILILFSCFAVKAQTEKKHVLDKKSEATDWIDFELRFDSLSKALVADIEGTLPYFESLKVEKGKKLDTALYARYLLSLGKVYMQNAEYSGATNEFTQALRLYESIRDNAGIAKSLMYLGNLFYFTNNYSKSIEYLKTAEQILVKKDLGMKERPLLGKLHNSYGLVFFDIDQNDSAIYHFEKAINAKSKDSKLYRDNLAMVYEHVRDYQKAADQYEASLKAYLADSSTYNIAWNAYHLARVYTGLKNEERSMYYLNLAEEHAVKSNSLEIEMEIAYAITRHYVIFGYPDSAIEKLAEFNHKNNELMEERTDELQYEFETKYQLEKKEAALQLSKENEERLAIQNRNQKIVIGLSILVLIILGGVLALAIRFYKQKRKINEMELSIKDSKLDELLSSQESSVLAAIIKGQNEERDRVAQELHDRLGGTLAALKMSLKQKSEHISEEEMEIVNEAVKEVRSISHNLSTGVAQQFGFNQAVELLVERMKKSTNLQFEIALHAAVLKLGQTAGIELYRIVQELFANTLKHAEATEVSLQTNYNGGVFNLIYEDNGKGFEASSEKAKKGIGLFNIKQRVDSVGGNLNIDSMPKRGTIVIIDIDLNQKA